MDRDSIHEKTRVPRAAKSSKANRKWAPTAHGLKREGGNSNSKASNPATWGVPERVLDSG